MADLGEIVPLGLAVTDAAGAPVDPVSVALSIVLPDGSVVSPTPTRVELGRYGFDYVPPTAGRYSVRWTTETPTTAFTDVFDVREAAPPLIISLEEAKRFINLTGTAADEELRGFIESASGMVEGIVGPVVRRTVVERHAGTRASTLALRKWPVLSLTSITDDAGVAVIDPSALSIDYANGIISTLYGYSLPWVPLTVTYVAGRLVIPAEIKDATKIITEHLFQTQRGWAGRPGLRGETAQAGEAPRGFALPARAEQLLDHYRQVVVA